MLDQIRRQTLVSITDEGRDNGKHFLITEMSAFAAESWAMRAILAVLRSGGELPKERLDAISQIQWTNEDGTPNEEVAKKGMALIAVTGIELFSGVDPERIKPLLDEMMKCVDFVPDPANLENRHKLFPNEIQEVRTILRLRAEFISLHTGFSLTGALSTIKGSPGTRTSAVSSTTQTSPTA